jgi:hypothetical protein
MLRILTAFLLASSLAGVARAADYSYAPPPPVMRAPAYTTLPACDEPGVLTRVTDIFAYQDAHVTLAGLAINRIDGVRERALKAGGPSLTDVRYCSGTAWLSSGRASEVVFIIEGPMKGTFSIGWNVESCVVGYDPWHVYEARCRSIRP